MLGVGIAVVVLAAVMFTSRDASTASLGADAARPVTEAVASRAQGSCWFKVQNRSSRSDQVSQWRTVSATGARTERIGDLLIVTGGIQPGVRGDHFYGCSLYEYTEGSPVVMSATSAPGPVRPDTLIPYGFSPQGRKLQQ